MNNFTQEEYYGMLVLLIRCGVVKFNRPINRVKLMKFVPEWMWLYILRAKCYLSERDCELMSLVLVDIENYGGKLREQV